MSKSARRTIEAKERGPGAGRYFLPSTVGFLEHDASKRMEPAYSFGRRIHYREHKRIEDGPGPAYFINPCITRFGMDGTPAYSLLSRPQDLKTFKTPSPRRYFPELVHPQREKKAPRYSLGLRTRYRRKDQNPAPSSYTLPKLIGPSQPNTTSAAAFSMKGRHTAGSYLEDLANAPGPGQALTVHPDVYMSKAPHYSLGSKNYMSQDKVQKPGPGAHNPERVTINRVKAPRPSLGIRHTEYVCPIIP